jgi:hypothetical protein
MNGNLMWAIQLFSDVCKGERFVARKKAELDRAVTRIRQEDMAEYVRITEKMNEESAAKIDAIEQQRGRGRPRSNVTA